MEIQFTKKDYCEMLETVNEVKTHQWSKEHMALKAFDLYVFKLSTHPQIQYFAKNWRESDTNYYEILNKIFECLIELSDN